MYLWCIYIQVVYEYMLGVLLYPYSFEIDSFSDPGARLLAGKPSELPVLLPHATTLTSFYMGSGDLESIAHTSVPNSFTS